MANGEQIGQVRKVNAEKGFGFIDADGVSYFFHRTMCQGGVRLENLREGDSVRFTAGQSTEKGERASRVWAV
jgi:cold shock CspA family protein